MTFRTNNRTNSRTITSFAGQIIPENSGIIVRPFRDAYQATMRRVIADERQILSDNYHRIPRSATLLLEERREREERRRIDELERMRKRTSGRSKQLRKAGMPVAKRAPMVSDEEHARIEREAVERRIIAEERRRRDEREAEESLNRAWNRVSEEITAFNQTLPPQYHVDIVNHILELQERGWPRYNVINQTPENIGRNIDVMMNRLRDRVYVSMPDEVLLSVISSQSFDDQTYYVSTRLTERIRANAPSIFNDLIGDSYLTTADEIEECPICLESSYLRMLEHDSRHRICTTCKTKIDLCPFCRIKLV